MHSQLRDRPLPPSAVRSRADLIALQRSAAERDAIAALAQLVEPSRFEQAFGAPLAQLSELVAAKTVTIPLLLRLAPPGTVDPTAFLYNNTMYVAAGLSSMALASVLFIRPVAERHFTQPAAAVVEVPPAAQQQLPPPPPPPLPHQRPSPPRNSEA